LVDFPGQAPSSRLERLIADDHVGGVCLFRKNVASAAQVARLGADLQRVAREANAPAPWISIDHEGGVVNRFVPAAPDPTPTPLPSAMAVGATGDPEFARTAGRVAGVELRAMGIHLNYAPVMDVNSNPDNPVIGARAFGEVVGQVEAMGLAYVAAHQHAGTGATVKHFPGHGDVTVDSHVTLPQVDHGVERLDTVELRPFRAAAGAGVAAVMTAHIVFPALEPERTPATMSRRILDEILRGRWGYEGLVISDSLSMRAIVDHYGIGDAAVASVQAGCDLLLALGPDPWQDEILDRLAVAIEQGRISAARLAAVADRLTREARRWHVGDPAPARLLDLVGSEPHLEAARRIAESAITIVRDRGGALPIRGNRVGVTTVGAGSGECAPPAFAASLRRHRPVTELPASDARAGDLDCLIAVTCSRGALPADEAATVHDLHRRFGDRLIVVATGDPYDILQFPGVPAYVLSYGPDEMSLDATARVLVGLIPARGRLPVTLGHLHPAGCAWDAATP
jgi:beta-N-acetylhexosaminidase